MGIYMGVDVSKGYADFCVLTEDGEVLHQRCLDDTRSGHDDLEELIEACCRRQAGVVRVGVEATGGLEINWLSTLKQLEASLSLETYQLNPYVVRKFVDQRLHVNKTDQSSAFSLADYLRRGNGEAHVPYQGGGPSPGLQTLVRRTRRMIGESVRLKNELHALLQRAHPELVQYVRGHMSQWVLKLLEKYPTPSKLIAAGPHEVAEIPYVSQAKAERLVEAARSSVAGQADDDTGTVISLIAEDLLRYSSRIDALKEHLWERVKVHRAPHLLASIPGIGRWSATVLYCEIGDIHRFDSPQQLVAYAGLDPRREESGDGQYAKGISKQGNRHIRSVLYGSVTAAIHNEGNPPIRSLYDRLRQRGKHQKTAEIACMRKLLAIAYGCWTNDRWFDPDYERRLKKRQAQKASGGSRATTVQFEVNHGLDAPVSAREARKRRGQATPPQKSTSPSIRGQGTCPNSKVSAQKMPDKA